MISMTGFSSGSFVINSFNFTVEIKSYNHKYLDIFLKLPKYLNFLEAPIRKEITENLKRGRVEIYINLQESGFVDIINYDKFKKALKLLSELKKEFKLKGEIGFGEIFLLKETFISGPEINNFDPQFQEKFILNFKKILKNFVKTRMDEGKVIEAEVLNRLSFIEKKVKILKNMLPRIKEKQKEKIKKRFDEIFLKGFDSSRLEQEIVYLLDKTDVSEEIARLEGHLKNFKKIAKQKNEIGKKLDFYLQEIFRELNTLSVKSQDCNISELVIDLKTETEKIREIIQNVE
ncbi:MAG: YicC family protein [Proteobacteria bacterium]|nr:YicC family protein [Pseudomonadota bacterium]